VILDFSKKQMKKDLPPIRVGDKVKIYQKVKEGEKERTTSFEGIVIAKRGSLHMLAVKVRKVGAGGIGIEKTFLVHHPNITKIKILRHGKVRRAKLYYLRTKTGKKAKLKERKALAEAIVWEEPQKVEEESKTEEEPKVTQKEETSSQKEKVKEEGAEEKKEEKASEKASPEKEIKGKEVSKEEINEDEGKEGSTSQNQITLEENSQGPKEA